MDNLEPVQSRINYTKIPREQSLVSDANHPFLRGKDILIIVLKQVTSDSYRINATELANMAQTVCRNAFINYMKDFDLSQYTLPIIDPPQVNLNEKLSNWRSFLTSATKTYDHVEKLNKELKIDNLKLLKEQFVIDKAIRFYYSIVRYNPNDQTLGKRKRTTIIQVSQDSQDPLTVEIEKKAKEKYNEYLALVNEAKKIRNNKILLNKWKEAQAFADKLHKEYLASTTQ